MLQDSRLDVFSAVAETGGFTKAAQRLRISQPSVSQQIGALEKELGVRLFDRVKGETRLTDAGRLFKEYSDRIRYWYSMTGTMFGESGRLTSNKPVRIATDYVVASYILPSALSTLMSSHHELNFEISRLSTDSSESEDMAGTHFTAPKDADVEISLKPCPETMDFEGESKLVGVIEAMVVSSPVNRSVAGAKVTDADDELTVKPFSTIAGIPVSNRLAVWSEYMPLLTPDLVARTSLVCPSVETIKSLVENSDSVLGIVPAIAVRKELMTGKLLQMPIPLPNFVFDVHFNPLEEFEEKSVCRLLLQALKDAM